MIKNNFFKKYIVLLVFLLFSLFFITGCSDKSINEDVAEKSKSEILYLDSKILYLLNSLNNITDANYYVSIQEVNENQDPSQSSETTGSKETQGGSSQEQSASGSSGGQGNSSQGENGSSGKNLTKTSQMTPDIISERDAEIDWTTIESTIQTIYSSWSVIILDLYKLNANNEDILGFSSTLDECMQSIIQKDKGKSLTNLANLYSYLPKFLEGHTNDNKINSILKIKSNIVNAYSNVEIGNWLVIKEQINIAESNFNALLNNIPENENSIYNVNKAYVVFKELQNSIDTQNPDIFYLKYRNTISELNILT